MSEIFTNAKFSELHSLATWLSSPLIENACVQKILFYYPDDQHSHLLLLHSEYWIILEKIFWCKTLSLSCGGNTGLLITNIFSDEAISSLGQCLLFFIAEDLLGFSPTTLPVKDIEEYFSNNYVSFTDNVSSQSH